MTLEITFSFASKQPLKPFWSRVPWENQFGSGIVFDFAFLWFGMTVEFSKENNRESA